MSKFPKLSDEEIEARLTSLTGWAVVDGRLEKKYNLKDFVRALTFVNAVGEAAEAAGHHPDIFIRYALVTLQWWTWGSGGITGRDFELAARCDSIYERLKEQA